MNGWLSEIEKAWIPKTLAQVQVERMARVIRELAEYALIVELEEKCIAYGNLSPDAKKLIGG